VQAAGHWHVPRLTEPELELEAPPELLLLEPALDPLPELPLELDPPELPLDPLPELELELVPTMHENGAQHWFVVMQAPPSDAQKLLLHDPTPPPLLGQYIAWGQQPVFELHVMPKQLEPPSTHIPMEHSPGHGRRVVPHWPHESHVSTESGPAHCVAPGAQTTSPEHEQGPHAHVEEHVCDPYVSQAWVACGEQTP
jgi:hypothetical protein